MPCYTNFFWATFFILYDPLEFSTGACPTPSGSEIGKMHHCALYVSTSTLPNVIKTSYFLDTPTQSLIANVIYGWSHTTVVWYATKGTLSFSVITRVSNVTQSSLTESVFIVTRFD